MLNLATKVSRILAASAVLGTMASTATAEGDLTQQDAIVIEVEIGAEDGTKWVPDTFEFETGKLYRLVLNNSSEYGIYVGAPAFSKRIFTRKVQTYGIIDGEVQRTAEVKGNVNELEVFAGQKVDWWFVPVQTTKKPVQLCCTSDDDVFGSTVVIK